MRTTVSLGFFEPRLRTVQALVVLALLQSCSCGDPRLVIVRPDQGATLGANDDRDATTGGLQYDVDVDVTGLPVGEVVTVFTGSDANTLLESGTSASALHQPGGHALVRVTLGDGDFYLVACARAHCSVRSPKRHIRVEGSLGTCPLVQFTVPSVSGASGTGTLTLPASSDERLLDGACGAAFGTTVSARVAASDGVVAHLFVDGIPTAHATVTAGVVTFASVVLGVRGADTSTLHIEVEGSAASCAAEFPRPIAVGCGGPTCRLESPIAGLYLNDTLDEDPDSAGLDANFALDGPVSGVGRAFTLRDDTTQTVLGTTMATSASGKAVGRFLGVPLAEGAIRLAGQCTDASAVTNAAIAEYIVDSIGCTPSFDAPTAGTIFTPADDTDMDLSNGLSTLAEFTVTGDHCTDFRVAPCPALTTNEFKPLTGTNASGLVSLGTSGTQEICAEVRDVAGNLDQDQVAVAVVTTGVPTVQIASPTTGAKVNRAGGIYLGTTYLADAVPSTGTCEVDVQVDCSALDTPVELRIDGAIANAPMANCAVSAASALGGRATFTHVSFAAGTVTAHTLVARQNHSGLVGTSPTIGIGADCVSPVLAISAPTCGGFIGMPEDQSAAPGIQASVTVASPNTPQVDVTVTVATSVGTSSSITSLASSLPPNATAHTIPAIDFGGAGTVQLAAATVDAFGNPAVTPLCSVTLTGIPAIQLAPLATTTFNAANRVTHDCVPGTSSLDLTISGTTDATAGSNVTLKIGSGAPLVTTVAAGGTFSGCVAAPEGTSNVTAIVTDLVGADGISGTAAAVPFAVNVRTVPPPSPIDPVTVTIANRRLGVANLAFTAVPDAMMAPLDHYELRCADAAIVTEADWSAATVGSLDAHTPANPGVADAVVARGFLTGTASPCVLRGFDIAGNVTPLPSATGRFTVRPAFLVATYNGTIPQGSMGVTGMRAVGDVNGDALADFLVSGESSAYLFLGQAAGAPPILATTFSHAPTSKFFGSVVRGIGDFNADGIDDVAIADPITSTNSLAGEVFVFYGRATWSAMLAVDTSSCAASFCVRGAPGSRLGFDVLGLGNFDGSTGADVAIASPGASRVYVVSGRNDIASGTTFVVGTSDPLGFAIVAPGTDPNFGWTLGAPGNVSGSGSTDLVIGENGNYPMVNGAPSMLYRVSGRVPSAASGFTLIAGSTDIVPITTDATLASGFATNDYGSIPFSDFDGDTRPDLFGYTFGTTGFAYGTWLVYGDVAATYPYSGAPRMFGDGSETRTDQYFGAGTSFGFDPNFGHLGDLNGDQRDEYGVGTITMTGTGTFSVGLLYGRTARIAGDYNAKLHPREVAVLAPVVENYPAANGPIWHLGFPGDVVRDAATTQRDLVVCDPGTGTPFVAGDAGRIFVLY